MQMCSSSAEQAQRQRRVVHACMIEMLQGAGHPMGLGFDIQSEHADSTASESGLDTGFIQRACTCNCRLHGRAADAYCREPSYRALQLRKQQRQHVQYTHNALCWSSLMDRADG